MSCLSPATNSLYRSCPNGRTCQVWRRAAAVVEEEAAAAVAAVLEAEEASVEATAHPQCMAVAEEEGDMVVAHRWDEVDTEVATVPEVAATTHTELQIRTKPASRRKTVLQRFMRHSQRLANELFDQRCAGLHYCNTQRPLALINLIPAVHAGTNNLRRCGIPDYLFGLYEIQMSGQLIL